MPARDVASLMGLDTASILSTIEQYNPFAAKSGVTATQNSTLRAISPGLAFWKKLVNSGSDLWNQIYKDYYSNAVTLEPNPGETEESLSQKFTWSNIIWSNWASVVSGHGVYDQNTTKEKVRFRNTLALRYGIPSSFVALAAATMEKMRGLGKVPDSIWSPSQALKNAELAEKQAMAQGGISGLAANAVSKAKTIAHDIESAGNTALSVGGFAFKYRKPLILAGVGIAGYIYLRPIAKNLGRSIKAMKRLGR